jgi:hypothetical protein
MKAWHEQVQSAREPEQVVRATREFIASLTPEQWAAIPENCRPERIRDVDDILYWRERLTEEFLGVAKDAKANDTLREILGFFTVAADRVS